MPTHDPIAAAKREAKARSRKGGVTHQQALDEIARDKGHTHWRAMTDALADALPADPVRPFVDAYRNDEHGIDDDVRALLEDAIHGYVADRPLDIADYVESYEFRGDGFDHMPDERQRAIMVDAITRFEAMHPRPAPTLADVERETIALMKAARGTPGLGISQWVSERMRAAAARAIESGGSSGERRRSINPIPMDAVTMAQAVDPDGAPFRVRRDGTVHARCPVHDDRSASLVIAGSGLETGVRCMAGCSPSDLNDAVIAGLTRAAGDAVAFMAANDRSPVVSGATRGDGSVGGRGGRYTLEDGSHHELLVLACRMLADGYPRWLDDARPAA